MLDGGAGGRRMVPDKVLIGHLRRLETEDIISLQRAYDVEAINCECIWARPPTEVISAIQGVQQQLSDLLGKGNPALSTESRTPP